MTKEDTIALLKGIKNYYNDKNEDSYVGFDDEDNEAIDTAIKALEQEPCEDCISRQATVERLCKVAEFMNEKRNGLGSPYVMAALFIQDNKDEFPSVTPQPKIGEWLHPYKSDIACECSKCHIQMPITNYFNYCPNCGAKMEVNADADSD